MQMLDEEFDKYSDVLDADFFEWEDDLVSGNGQFSDVENVFGSKNLVKSLQSTSNNVRSQINVSPLCRKKIVSHGNIEALTCKKVNISKRNASYDRVLQKDHKQVNNLSQQKIKSNSKKRLDDSDDFCSPDKKRKIRKILSLNDSVKYEEKTCIDPVEEKPDQGVSKSPSDSMTISSHSSGSQKSISSQGSCGSKMITSSQEISPSQKMITSSQEISPSQKMITSSQETSASQNITFSQECTSPKRITSSQESLGNEVMNISINEDSHIMNNASQSSSGTRIVITPHQKNSNCQKILTREGIKSSKVNYLKEEITDSKYLTVFDQKTLGNKAVSSKETRKLGISDYQEKKEFTKNLASSVSDSFCSKTTQRYNKTDRRMIWSSIRKRELLVTKKENAVEIREKLLDAREADILKREEILKAKERKYLKHKANMKKWINQKLTSNSKKMRRRVGGVLEDCN